MIITNNEEALRVFCHPVLPDEIGSLIDSLEKELINSNRLGRPGIGLAAPQIGMAKHIAIIRLPKIKLDLINASIIKSYDEKMFTDEGCLSFPGRLENTMRFQEIQVNNAIEPNNFIATGLLAVAIQHELDHLNCKLFMDRTVPKSIPIKVAKKVGPNELCICGSNIKFKKCCGRI